MYKFFTAVLRYEFSRPKWQPIVSGLQKTNRLLDIFLGVGIVAGLVGLIKYAPILENKRWTAIILLAFLVLFATWLLAVVKRFHKNTLAEIYKAQEEMNRQLEFSAKNRLELLTLLLGRSDALYFLLDNRTDSDNDNAGIPIAKNEFRYYEADIQNTFRDRLGSPDAQDYFQRLGTVPENLSGQVARINAHRNKLHEMLQSEHAQQRQINQKAVDQKQETLQRVGKN
jgi:hypothetical protein